MGCALFFFLSFYQGKNAPVLRFFDFWIPTVVAFFFLILIKSNRKPEDPFHFWEGLVYGNAIFWSGGLISGLLIMFFSQIWPLAFQNFITSGIEYLELTEKNLPENLKMPNLDKVMVEMKQTQPSFMVWDELKKKVMYSFLLVPIIALLLRRKN
jgi:hypothetical protein